MAPGGSAYGCGQCMPCRINKRRLWTHRIMLEATQHSKNSFWTLTFDDANLTLNKEGIPNLETAPLKDFIKRLRFHHQPEQLRYFNVGEYGSQTWRPHYHLALFNYPGCSRGVTQLNRRGTCCSVCDRVAEIWGKGLVYSGQLEDASAAYVAGYVTKKLTDRNDPRLQGRNPEFARMSLKPGIGAGFIPEVASVLLSHNLAGPQSPMSDVPTSLRHGPTVRPLGRYLTRQLRMHVGMEPNAPLETIQKREQEMQPLREAAQVMAPKGTYSETYKALIIDVHEGKYIQTMARHRRQEKRESL